MSAAQLVRDLKGTWFGKSGMARCPAHDDRSPSLSIADGHDGKILVKCFAGCTGAAVIAALGHLGHWSNGPRGSYTAPREPAYMPGSDDAVRIRRALAICGEARDLDGTPGLTYLASRGVDIQALPNLRHALRWHPSCPWEGGPQGCILGIFTDILTGEPRAIHRTAIAPSGVQIGKKMLGPVAGCVIRLWPDSTVSTGLVLGEGVVTVLAAATRIAHRGTRLAPAWAAGSAGGMAKFPALAGVEALTLLVDNDASGAGQSAAAECSARWTTAGREVVRLVPDIEGSDFADMVPS